MEEEKTYIIKSIEDILKVVNKDNLKFFVKDFELWLKFLMYAKDDKLLSNALINKNTFRWIDDEKNNFHLTINKKRD